MTLEPLIHAPMVVRLHLATVIPAFFLGTWLIFLSRKGAQFHRALGYVYLTLLVLTSITVLFIRTTGPGSLFGFGPIHLFVPLVLFGVFGALRGAWTHNIGMHRRAMLGVYFGGLVIAGALTFLPGRIMHAAAFGS